MIADKVRACLAYRSYRSPPFSGYKKGNCR